MGILRTFLDSVLGITFDSHCFPLQNQFNPNPNTDNNITRLTVMIGGDRRKDLLNLNTEEITNLTLHNLNKLFNNNKINNK